MTSLPNNFVKDSMNAIETMNSSHDTFISKQLNINTNSFTYKILNSHPIENYINISDYEKICLEEFDNVIRELDAQYNKYDFDNDLSYNILDLDNMEYIIQENKKNTAPDSMFVDNDVKDILHEHNYCMTKTTTPTCEEKLDISKLEDFFKTKEKSFNDNDNFIGVDYNVEKFAEPFCDTEINFQNLNSESVNFEIITDHFSSDNKSIYTISDEKIRIDIEVPDLDVSIISESYIEENFDLINESDSDSCSYHSSDFEFIEEDEAKRDGLIINHNPHTITQTINYKTKTVELLNESISHKVIFNYNNVQTVNNNIDHEIPRGTNYVNMFERNIPYPVHCMENKSIHTNNCGMQFQNLVFNMRLYGDENVEKYIRDEANESEKKIIRMYPSENRHMRQRRRI